MVCHLLLVMATVRETEGETRQSDIVVNGTYDETSVKSMPVEDPQEVSKLNEGDDYCTNPVSAGSIDAAPYTVFQLQKLLSVTEPVVPGVVSEHHYSDKSDISYTMNRLIYEEDSLITPGDNSLSLPEPSDDDKSQTSDIGDTMGFEKNVMEVPKSLALPKPLKLEFELLLDLVRTSSIPVVICVATLTGLAPKRKSALFQDFVLKAVSFRDSKSELADRYRTRLEERCSKEGLSSFNFNILGEFHFSDLMWLLATYSSIILCFLCCLLQALELRGISLEYLYLPQNEFDDKKDELLGNKHGEWLFYEAIKRMKALKKYPEKLNLLRPGVTMLNVFNIGPSKAAYNFLPFLGRHCKRSLPLLFVSAADLADVNEPLESDCLKECETSINHLLSSLVPKKKHLHHFVRSQSTETAAPPVVMHQSSCTRSHLDSLKEVLEESGLNSNFEEINLSNMDDTKKILEKMVVKNMSKYVTGLPVRWVFLRSLLQASDISLITKSDIVKLATSSNVGIDASEVEAFLTTFTSFASLLYIPSLTEVVLVDIERFTDCLDKVFSYDDSSDAPSFGFITEAAIDQLAEAEKLDEKLDADLFKTVLKSFRFAVPVPKSKVKGANFSIQGDYTYYVPSMRPSSATNGPRRDSLYLHNTPSILGNMQVLLVRHFLKHSNCSLVPYLHINASVIRVNHGKEFIDVTIIDHKDIIELRLKRGRSTEAYKATCSLAVQVCAAAMDNAKKSVEDLEYHFMLRCVDSTDSDHQYSYHRMDQSSLCDKCKAADSNNYPFVFRENWKSAVSKAYVKREENQKEDYEPFELTSLAVKLSEEFIDTERQSMLLQALGVGKEVWEDIQVKAHGWAMFLMLLTYWMKNCEGSRAKLEAILKKLHMVYHTEIVRHSDHSVGPVAVVTATSPVQATRHRRRNHKISGGAMT